MKYAWSSRAVIAALVGVMVLSAGLVLMADSALARKDDTDDARKKHTPPPVPAAVPRVVDANNNLVGGVIGTKEVNLGINNEPATFSGKPLYAVVALNISVPSIVVQVTSNGFLGTASLFFTDSTCVGQPYFLSVELDRTALRLFPVVGVGKNGTALYAPRTSSAPVLTLGPYLLTFLGECQQGGNEFLIIADPILDLSTQFTPPYRFVYP